MQDFTLIFGILKIMKKIIAKLVLKIWGWKVVLDGDKENLNRCVVVVAPHTHNVEYVLGVMAYWTIGKPFKIIIKDAHTKAWYGFVIKALGGIGINRSQRNDLVNVISQEFEKEDFSLIITPEGTRSFVQKWKKGFYHIAMQSQLPVALAVGDFKAKKMYIGHTISFEKLQKISYQGLLDEISKYIRDRKVEAKIPKNWNPNIQ